jgi:hypothetical protein
MKILKMAIYSNKFEKLKRLRVHHFTLQPGSVMIQEVGLPSLADSKRGKKLRLR